MAVWKKKPFEFKLVGLEQGSAAKPYEVVVSKDLRDGRRFVSCNCMSWTRGKHNKGLQSWQRTCKHTQRGYTVDSPEIDFAGEVAATWIDEPEEGGRIPFQKPMLPARFEKGRDEKILNDPDWIPTVKMDGHRALVVRQPYGKVEFFSRGGKRMMSVEPAFQDLVLSIGTMIDCELVVADLSVCNCPDRDGQRKAFESVAHFRSEHPEALRLVVLDVLFVDGESVMGVPYWQRRVAVADILAKLADERVSRVESKPVIMSTEDWLVSIRSHGAEGAVFWNHNSPYRPGIRSSADMIKKKWGRVIDMDVVVVAVLPPTEKTPGHRLAYGYADGKQVGIVPGILGDPEKLKQYVGQVVELKAHEVLPSGALLYPELVRFRDDKTAEECERP